MTIIKTASVKVMRSFDYCHFEAAMSLENESGVTTQEIDNARKDCQRLTDKAVKQYQIAKASFANRSQKQYEKNVFISQCKAIEKISPGDRTINETAMLKQYQDENWQTQFDNEYDYQDEY